MSKEWYPFLIQAKRVITYLKECHHNSRVYKSTSLHLDPLVYSKRIIRGLEPKPSIGTLFKS